MSRIEILAAKIQAILTRIEKDFPKGVRFTFVARHPSRPEWNMILSRDDPEQVAKQMLLASELVPELTPEEKVVIDNCQIVTKDWPLCTVCQRPKAPVLNSQRRCDFRCSGYTSDPQPRSQE